MENQRKKLAQEARCMKDIDALHNFMSHFPEIRATMPYREFPFSLDPALFEDTRIRVLQVLEGNTFLLARQNGRLVAVDKKYADRL